MSQLKIFQSCRDWNKVLPSSMAWSQVFGFVGVDVYVHAMGRQWCPNPDHYTDSEPAIRSLTRLCWALSRAAEPQILSSFVWRSRGSNHQPPACTTTLPGHGAGHSNHSVNMPDGWTVICQLKQNDIPSGRGFTLVPCSTHWSSVNVKTVNSPVKCRL